MAVEAAQGLAHHVDRHDAGDDRMLLAQPRGERRIEALGRHVQLVAQRLGGLLQLAEIIAVGLDQIAHALDRVGLEARALVAVGHLRRRQRLALPRLGIGRVEPLQRMGDAGTELGEVAQLLLRQVDLAEQRIGEDLVQFGEEAVLVGGGEIAQVEVVGLGKAQQDLRGDRALVPLDQVDVARRNAEPLGDLGLRQPQLLADAPETGADEEFFPAIGGHGSLSDLFCDKIYKTYIYDKFICYMTSPMRCKLSVLISEDSRLAPVTHFAMHCQECRWQAQSLQICRHRKDHADELPATWDQRPDLSRARLRIRTRSRPPRRSSRPSRPGTG